MSIGSETDWKNAYAALPLVSTSAWKTNLADYLGDLLDGLLVLTTYSQSDFTFGRAAFAAGLTDTNGVAGLQTAFNNGVLASTFSIPIGTTFGGGTPAETFSTIGTAVPDAPSIASGQAILATLVNAPQTSDPLQSEFPVKLRNAFLALTYTVTGTNSVSPTPGPINDVNRGVG